MIGFILQMGRCSFQGIKWLAYGHWIQLEIKLGVGSLVHRCSFCNHKPTHVGKTGRERLIAIRSFANPGNSQWVNSELAETEDSAFWKTLKELAAFIIPLRDLTKALNNQINYTFMYLFTDLRIHWALTRYQMPKQMPKWDMNSALGKPAFLTHIKVRGRSVTRAWGCRGGVNSAGGGQGGAICSALKNDTGVGDEQSNQTWQHEREGRYEAWKRILLFYILTNSFTCGRARSSLLWWLLLVHSTCSRGAGSVVVAHGPSSQASRLQSTDSAVVAHTGLAAPSHAGSSRPGIEPTSPALAADSYPLDHQESLEVHV